MKYSALIVLGVILATIVFLNTICVNKTDKELLKMIKLSKPNMPINELRGLIGSEYTYSDNANVILGYSSLIDPVFLKDKKIYLFRTKSYPSLDLVVYTNNDDRISFVTWRIE